MDAYQQIVQMTEFARDVLATDDVFAERVRRFEGRFGHVSSQTLAVMAQASLFCWFDNEYERDFLEVCHAIGQEKPTSQFLCGQVTPARWIDINTYVVGVQKWLGCSRPAPADVDGKLVLRIGQWLGDRAPAKIPLCELFLLKLIDDLWNYTSLAKLGGETSPDGMPYPDFTEWYSHDGRSYATGHAPTDDDRVSWLTEAMPATVEHLTQRARDAMGSSPEEAEELVRGTLIGSQPPCMHRYTRYLDIQITSIGALKWRGTVPPSEDRAKYRAADWLNQAADEVRAWVEGASPQSPVGRRIHEALGAPSDRKKALVGDFFNAERRGGWRLVHEAKQRGRTACCVFGGSEDG